MAKFVKHVLSNIAVPAAGAIVNTLGIPTAGAREVVVIVTGSGGALQTPTIQGGVSSGQIIFSTPSLVTLTQVVAGQSLANGCLMFILPTGGVTIRWPWIRFNLVGNAGASPANDSIVTLTIYVNYEGERDATDTGQFPTVPA